MKKVLLFGIPSLLIIIALSILFGYTYKVGGTVSDIATGQPVKDVKLSIDNKKAVSDEKGRYEIPGLRIYQKKKLNVDTPKEYYKPEPVAIKYSSRNVKEDLKIEPTVEQMANLVEIASINGQHDYLWDFMYPDDKTYWGDKNTYVSLFKQRTSIQQKLGFGIKSSVIGQNIRTLPTWKSPITGKDYQDVVEIPFNTVAIDNGKEQPSTVLEYLKKIDGFYHYFTGANKEELQKFIQQYSALAGQ